LCLCWQRERLAKNVTSPITWREQEKEGYTLVTVRSSRATGSEVKCLAADIPQRREEREMTKQKKGRGQEKRKVEGATCIEQPLASQVSGEK
jgi:hypothetical protein